MSGRISFIEFQKPLVTSEMVRPMLDNGMSIPEITRRLADRFAADSVESAAYSYFVEQPKIKGRLARARMSLSAELDKERKARDTKMRALRKIIIGAPKAESAPVFKRPIMSASSWAAVERPLRRIVVRSFPSVWSFGDPAPGMSALDHRRSALAAEA